MLPGSAALSSNICWLWYMTPFGVAMPKYVNAVTYVAEIAQKEGSKIVNQLGAFTKLTDIIYKQHCRCTRFKPLSHTFMCFILNIIMGLLVYKVIVIKCSLTHNGVIIEGGKTITSAKQRLRLKYMLRFCVIVLSNINTCILITVNTDNRAFVSPRTMKDFLLKTSLHEMVVCSVSMH